MAGRQAGGPAAADGGGRAGGRAGGCSTRVAPTPSRCCCPLPLPPCSPRLRGVHRGQPGPPLLRPAGAPAVSGPCARCAGCWLQGAGCWVLGAGCRALLPGAGPGRAAAPAACRRAPGAAAAVVSGGRPGLAAVAAGAGSCSPRALLRAEPARPDLLLINQPRSWAWTRSPPSPPSTTACASEPLCRAVAAAARARGACGPPGARQQAAPLGGSSAAAPNSWARGAPNPPPGRWGEVSGRHIDLQVGDICDWEFLSQAFTVSC